MKRTVFSAANADISTWARLDFISGAGTTSERPRTLFVTAQAASDPDGGSLAPALALVDKHSGEVLGYTAATATVTARRTNFANNAGGYVVDIEWPVSGSNAIDIGGGWGVRGQDALEWRFGFTALPTLSSVAVPISVQFIFDQEV